MDKDKAKEIASIAIAGIVTLTAISADKALAATQNYVKCYGAAESGKNDCATALSACAGTIKVDHACYAWAYKPLGVCQQIAGASVGKPAANCVLPNGKPAT